MQPLLDLVPQPQARMAHCGGHLSSAGPSVPRGDHETLGLFPICPLSVITNPCPT